MNRHTKLALMVAPFLILGGYIASDFYVEQQAQQTRVFKLQPFGHCDVLNQKCILKSGEFEVNIYDKAGITTVNATFPLDSATFFLVNSSNQASVYPLGMQDSAYYWQSPTPLRERISTAGEKHKLRLIANIKGGQYIAEFNTQTAQ
ncbi:hypothetical protein SAMN05216262_11295 [Colwellia chukchiensis]|uniref:Uncharacterized protein n=1 Tax=Colwellia chukchiensis TaxID=641665 RepID=A0A1H7QUZ7_9GAMM|nr:hypothetical protein [Colwellia chukchiensis]SEL51137.1 hypothetical protein SAMN05216262_11295 [Colwellia chukchiensis]